MARNGKHILRRDERLIKAYTKLSNVVENGKQKFTHEWIVSELTKDFFIAEKTIEDILRKPR